MCGKAVVAGGGDNFKFGVGKTGGTVAAVGLAGFVQCVETFVTAAFGGRVVFSGQPFQRETAFELCRRPLCEHCLCAEPAAHHQCAASVKQMVMVGQQMISDGFCAAGIACQPNIAGIDGIAARKCGQSVRRHNAARCRCATKCGCGGRA